MNKKNGRLLCVDLILFILLVAVDHITKWIAVIKLKDQPAIPIIDGVLILNYLENRGAAFGMLQGGQILFVCIALLFLVVVGIVLFRIPAEKKYVRLHILLTLIASGAVGNLIDRLKSDFVVDFIYFVLIDFPIFNVADMYVTIATAILMIELLFVYREEDFAFLGFHQKNTRN